ncbi:MAG: aldose 1-epimerase family protein [Planctomycetes bacterium]|nr:aldose 1-epimerase family protein [Planctomycetota bacterium]
MTRQSHPVVSRGRGDTAATANDSLDIKLGRLQVRTGRIRGGRGDGMLVVELVAGTTRAIVLPDRGLGIWKAWSGPTELGWQSPVAGPVHPRGVPLTEPSGLGWLDGFDELVARCGLVSNGAPDFDTSGHLRHPLHGRIANLPAHHLDVTLDEATNTITLTGAVDETRFLVHALRLTTSLTVRADRPRISWCDTVKNISERPATMQLLYHVNLGPPLLAPGAEVVAAVEELAPRDAAAAADVPAWNRYDAPRAGRGEDVHLARLKPDANGRATALLVAPGGGRAAALSWTAATLPCFTLWKNQGGLADGYVTGLEPGTNFPNPRSFEETQGRVVPLAPNASATFDLALELLTGDAIAAERRRIESLVPGGPRIHSAPRPGWSPG